MKKNLIRAVAVSSVALISAGFSLAGVGVALAVTPDGLTGSLDSGLNSSINVDCDAATDFDWPTVYMATGTTATVNVTGTCDDSSGLYFETKDTSAAGTGGITVGLNHTDATEFGEWRSAPSSLTVDPNTLVTLWKTGGEDFVDISFVAVDDSPNPSGELGQTTSLGLPSTASGTNTFAASDDGDGNHLLGGVETCALHAGNHVYATYKVTVGAAGEYSFRVVDTSPLTSAVVAWGNNDLPIGDPFMAVYTDFDSANIDANVVGCNDDGFDNGTQTAYLPGTSATDGHTHLVNELYSQFVKNLQPGDYTLLLTTFIEYSTSDWNASIYPAQSATFELWGPAGAFIEPSEAPNTLPAALPKTGLASSSWALLTGVGVVAMGLALGIASVLLRRRKTT